MTDQFDDDNTQSFVALTKGTKVSHYEIVEKIGAGGMGEVFLAEDIELHRKVALKFLPLHLCKDNDCRKRFTREAQAAAKLDHPNIVPVFEVGEFQGRPFFAMAYIEGRPLKDIIKSGRVTVQEAINYTHQVCECLHKAHELGVIHRDIKPGNIIIDTEHRARVVDFGLAAVSGEEKLTRTDSTLGTVGYMSPEQIEGKQVDGRSDLFSVGVILYEMLTGRRPFEGDNDTAVMLAVTTSTPEPIARFKSGVTDGLQRVVDKALEKERGRRYQDAIGMLSDLRRLDVVSKPAARHRLAFWMAGLLVVVLAAVLLWTKPWNTSVGPDDAGQIRLAVLPFKNLGSIEDEYFADGVTEEILSRLAAIGDLGVISSTSSFAYKGTEKTIPQIAGELRVDYVLEGSIRWDKSGQLEKVRVTPQLIKADGDLHIWSHSYDEAFTNVFDVQSQIAGQIASILDIRLAPSEEIQISDVPTENMEAYAHYLKALDISYLDPVSFNKAIEHLNRAIELDSSFSAAYGELSYAMTVYNYFVEMTARNDAIGKAKTYAEKALALSPGQPYGYRALGTYYYMIERDYQKAETSFLDALERAPNDVHTLQMLGMLARRTGRWDEAMEYFLRAHRLDPSTFMHECLGTARMIRDYDLGLELVRTWMHFSPDNYELQVIQAYFIGLKTCDLDAFEAALPPAFEDSLDVAIYSLGIRDMRRMRGELDECLHMTLKQLEVAPNRFTKAIMFLDAAFCENRMTGRTASAYADSAISTLEPIRSQIPSRIVQQLFASALAMAYSERGDSVRARALVDTVLMDDPYPLDATNAPQVLGFCCYALINIGDHDRAIDLLDRMLGNPSYFTHLLHLKYDPAYDPLRGNPNFQALIAKYENDRGI